MDDKYEAVKRGVYDLEKEEAILNKILKDLLRGGKDISRDMKKVGLVNFKSTQSKRSVVPIKQGSKLHELEQKSV